MFKTSGKVLFIDRSKRHPKLLIVLAGYKELLWNKVFDRLKKYVADSTDVCIVCSGVDNLKLQEIATANDWSYMSTSINNLCLAQNECIARFPDAKYIFKMDEDMFVTKDVFSTLMKDYLAIKSEGYIVPSAIVPVINVNCITYQMLLRQKGLLKKFESETGIKPVMTNGLHHHKEVLESADMSKFMWTYFNIDDEPRLNMGMIPSPGRFSIGLILFERSIWEELGHFPVDLKNKEAYRRIGLGEDEKAICNFAMSRCKPLMIDTNTLVGHLGYGPQTSAMITFFLAHQNLF